MYPRLSIIVPVYNSSAFLNSLFASLLQQTDKEYEVVFIDDGSTDESGALLDGFAKDNQGVRIIHQENKGISGARNTGLRNVSGSHVLFIDADDYLENNAVELINHRIIRYNPDLIAFGLNYISQDGAKTPYPLAISSSELLESPIIKNRIIPCMINIRDDPEVFLYDYVWNKVFRRDLIERYGIFFMESRRIWEDRPFVVQYLKYTATLYAMEECLYNYMNVTGSLSTQYDQQFFDIILENHELYQNLFSGEYDFQTQYANDYWSRSIDRMIIRSLKQSNDISITKQTIDRIIHVDRVRVWFEGRENQTKRDKEMTRLLLDSHTDKIVRFYQKEIKQEQLKQFASKLKNTLKKRIKTLINR